MYNSPEERAMIQAATGNASVPGVVVGVGSDVPDRTDPERFRRKFKMRRPFAIYIGRIDENKGCGELFAHFQRYAAAFPRGMDLVLDRQRDHGRAEASAHPPPRAFSTTATSSTRSRRRTC